MNAIVIYSSRYGATKQYAQWIAEILSIPAKNVDAINRWELAGYDLIIIGSSIYMGRILLKKWLTDNTASLKNRELLFYIVGAATTIETIKTEGYFTDNIPADLLNPTNHFYLQGKKIFKELSLSDKFLLTAGAWLAKKKSNRKAMLTDFNAIKRNNLDQLIRHAQRIALQSQYIV